MKVVDVSEFYSERGGGVRSHLTVKGHVLCQLGVEHRIVAPGPRDQRAVESHGRGTEASVVVRIGGPSLPYDPTYHLLARPDKLRAFVADERPDVLEVHSPYVAAAASLSVPRDHFGVRTFFWHADFVDTYVRPWSRARVGERAGDGIAEATWALTSRMLGKFDATFVASEGQRRKLSAHGVPNVVTVPFGVDRDVFRPTAKDEGVRRSHLRGRPEGTALLVGVGRFAVEKRWDVVLDAFARIRAVRPAVLVLFGDGPERNVLEGRASRLGPAAADVTFMGFESRRDVLARNFASADLLLHACPFETFGLGIAEALAAGLPCIVPDEGGAAERVSDAAMRYPTGDADDLAARAVAFLEGSESERKARATSLAAEIPSVHDHFASMMTHYRALLDARDLRGRDGKAR
ncbi:MAG: glycosyltransferase [Polyangiaceae bacterium]